MSEFRIRKKCVMSPVVMGTNKQGGFGEPALFISSQTLGVMPARTI